MKKRVMYEVQVRVLQRTYTILAPVGDTVYNISPVLSFVYETAI